MWTAEQRTRHKVRVPEGKGYPTDVSDQESKFIEPLLPGAAAYWVAPAGRNFAR